MDEFSSLIRLPFKLGNLITEEQPFSSCVNNTEIELITSMTKLPLLPVVTLENKNSNFSIPQNGLVVKIESTRDKCKDSDDNILVGPKEIESRFIFSNAINKEIKGDDQTGLVGGPLQGIVVEDIVSVGKTGEAVSIKEPKRAFPAPFLEVSQETKIIKKNFPFDFPPLWGVNSICGRRAEMEDSAVALPRFLEIPTQMLSDGPVFRSVQDLTGHVFGVYDGHGGSQVSNYCQEHLHLALADEIRNAKENLHVEIGENSLNGQWLEIFRKCFQRLDNEVGGFLLGDEDITPIAPDSVGSTAVVAVICATHIIVANCGDSRAVLNRGKVPVPLSVDHRPNRDDECDRIEASGGKVINWDGYRVSGVLAVSRSIGDRYLRPYVISDPEIMIVPRTKEDECLILASDGLWDVMSNEEACDLARRRLLLWHKKNGPTKLSKERSHNIDPAAQDAADYLSHVAYQKGSRDNISVIVVDLKAQRKFKKKDVKV
ncbi:probable protein phosphatase 2c 6 [Phtheirospermum japonicum]|uniref:protein-serine/threonine phosphatase n=1 Tax=Phtheirospermum japonicum TaxID=374723 RepID=A0A830D4H8_9LAMI|nr:probable protein phosphatase 2c 6 [Phtheirospermum japonicum]